MKKTWLSRLNAIVLAVALLLPCVMTVPAMAAEGDGAVLYSWTPSGSGTAYDRAQEMVNNSVPRTGYAAIQTPAASDYGQYSNILFSATMNMAEGSRTQRFLSMYVGINAAGGLGSVEVSDGVNARRKTTEALKVTLDQLSAKPVGTESHKAIALTHLLAVRTTLPEEHGMIRDDDAVYIVHTTDDREWEVNGLRSWQLIGAGKLGTDDAVFYQVTSNDLLGDYTLAEGEQIDRIDYYPYGMSTSMDRGGYFHLGDVQLLGYADQTAFEADYADCHSYNTSVSEETLRNIVVAEAVAVKDYPWTTPNTDLIGRIVWGTDAEGNKVATSKTYYDANKDRTGPIYQRGSTNANDPLILLSTEAFQQMATDGQIVNRTFGGITAAPGMDCSTFVYNAISRVSTTMAYTNMFCERDNSLVRLGNLVATDDQPKFTDGDIINYSENTKDEVIDAYKQLKKGDVLNMFKLNSDEVHAMLVYADPVDGATGVEIIEQTSNAGSDTTNSRTGFVSFEDLYIAKYLPYTLKEYTQGVQNANVQLLVLPNDGSDWAKGVSTAAAASNYRILSMTATVTDSSEEVVASFTEYGWRSRNEHQIMDVTELNDALAMLPVGDYTLKLAVVSGPKTSVGGDTPVKTFTTETFTVAAPEPDEHVTTEGAVPLTGTDTTLAAGTTYYLNGNVTATANLKVGAGDAVTLCLNGYTLKADSDLTGNFITVSDGATLTICGGSAGNGTIRGCGTHDEAPDLCGVYIGKNGTATLESGVITGFKHVESSGGAVYAIYGTFTMNGGLITRNKGAYGGGVRVGSNGGTFIMNGGEISDNCATKYGDAIHTAASLTINGGTIRENSALSAVASSAIYANKTGKLTMNGGSITGNAGNGVYFANSEEGSLALNGGTITGNNTAGTAGRADLYIKYETVDDVQYEVTGSVSGATLGTWAKDDSAAPTLTVNYATLGTDPDGTDWIIRPDGVGCTKQGDVWVVGDVPDCTEHADATMLGKGTKTLDSGTYYLAADVEALSNIEVTGDVTLCLNNHTLTAPTSGGTFITVSAGANLTICGGKSGSGVISGRGEEKSAKGIYVNGGELVLDSGVITNFHNATYAGVHVHSQTAKFTMNGGTITGNVATGNGGGVSVNTSSAQFIMNGGSITNNTAGGNGGGVMLNAATAVAKLNGGTISGNTAGGLGGGIYLRQDVDSLDEIKNMTVTGNTSTAGKGHDIGYGLTTSDTGVSLRIGEGSVIGDVYLTNEVQVSGKTYHVPNMSVTEAEVGSVSMNKVDDKQGGQLTINSGTFGFNPEDEAYAGWVTLAENVEVNKISDTQWKVGLPTVCEEHASGMALYQADLDNYLVDGQYYILPSGVYYLAENVTVDKRFVFNDYSQQVTLCLNGKTMTGTYAHTVATDGLFCVVNGKLTITDSPSGGGKIDGSNAGKWLYMTGGEVVLQGGTITKFTNSAGGAGRITSGTFTMEGGTITDNTCSGDSAYGGAFHMGGGTVTVKGGTISNNTADRGAAFFFNKASTATLIITGGTITGNTTSKSADNAAYRDIQVGNSANASCEISGGEVDATMSGTNLTITGGTFTSDPTAWKGVNCTVDETAGKYVVTVNPGMCPIHAGTDLNAYLAEGTTELAGNTTYYLSDDLTATNNITVSGAVILCLNDHTITAPTTGGDFIKLNEGADLTICGGHKGTGTISGNDSVNNDETKTARGIYTYKLTTASLTLDSGKISGFKSTGNGAGVYVHGGVTFTMNGGTISGNEASGNGGGVFVSGESGNYSTMVMNGGTISGNKVTGSSKTGGGVQVNASGVKFTMTGGTISGNTATGDGGGIYNKGPVTISGGTISGNIATGSGGGIAGTKAIEISGGTFTGNEASKNGGVVYTTGAVTVSGGLFKGNTGKDGGVVYVGNTTADNNITGGTYVANHATNIGGFIRTAAATDKDTGATNVNITGGTYVNNTAVSNKQTFNLGNGGTITGVTVVSDSPTVSNKTGLFVGGKFSADPSNRLADTVPLTVKDISETITVDGQSYTLTKQVAPGFACSGAHIEFGSSLNVSLPLAGDNGVPVTNEYGVTLSPENGKEYSYTVEDIALTAEQTVPAVTIKGIAAKEMRDEITVTVTKGDVVYYTDTLSVYEIAKAWYDNGVFNKTMLADMLNYGAAAQKQFKHNTSVLEREEELTGSEDEIKWEHTNDYGVSDAAYAGKVSYTLSLKDKIQLNVYIDDATATITNVNFAGYEGEETFAAYTVTNNLELSNADKTITVTQVVFDDIDVVDAGEQVSFNVELSNNGGSFTVTYSIKDYVVSMLEGKQSAVVQALQKYVESVTNYINTTNS